METLFGAAIRNIKAEIEPEILIEAFGKKAINPFMILNVPIDTHIENEVILGQVVKDIQLFDSKEVPISLDGLAVVPINEDYATIYIPANRRGGRDIMGARAITYGSSQHRIGISGGNGLGGDMSAAASKMLSGLSRHMPDTEHDVELVAPNTILVNDRYNSINMAMVHVNLSVDDRLGHIRNATSLPFIELCVWKTKQLAYTQLNIAIGRNLIDKGKELGVFGDVLREYRDANVTYKELLGKFRTTLKLNDPVARKRIIRQRMPTFRF